MKRLSVRSKVMVIGFVLGLAATGLMASLIVGQKVGLTGMLIVSAVMLVTYIFGWYIGKEAKVSCQYNKAWEDGYREGRIDGALEVGVPVHPNCRCVTKEKGQ